MIVEPEEILLVQDLISFHEKSLYLLEELYDNNRRTINARIADIRKKCTHPKTTYHPDPSGNNDSCFTCDVCGLEKKRF